MIMRKECLLLPILIFIHVFLGCIAFSQPEYQKIDESFWEYIQGDDASFFEILEAFKRGDKYSGKAAMVLGKIGDPRATQDLCSELLRDGRYAEESLTALGMILDKRSVPILIRVVKEDRPYAQKAIEILAELKDDRAVPTLIQIIKDRKPYYLSAFTALGSIGDESVLPYLLEFLEKPTPEEPQDVRLRVIHRGKDDPSWKYTRTYQYLGRNIPPRVEIIDYGTSPIGIVWVRYQLFDDELDTLNITPEFSQDGGNSWSAATVEGITNNISSRNYEGELYWRTDKDNIQYSPQTKIVFKLTPAEKYAFESKGVYDVISIDVNYDEITIQDIFAEVNGNISFSVYYPGEIPATEDIFNYMYSLNGGNNWIYATAQRITEGEIIAPDTEKVVWKSDEDLPGFDSEDVSFLVSLGGGELLGEWVSTIPFHLDNNKTPSVKILSINDAELLEVEYQITDAEGDTIGLIPEFSLNSGASWERTTVSGNISKLTPSMYQGILKWYAEFDIPQIKESPVIIRLTPYDNDFGLPVDTKEFFIKPSYYAKPIAGLTKNDVALRYYNTISDSTDPTVQLSTDGGKNWRNVTAKSVSSIGYQDRYTNVINWETDKDITMTKSRMEVFTRVMNQVGNPSVVPELLLISRQKDSPSYFERRNAVQAIGILDQKPKWVVDGMVNSLMNESSIIRVTAEGYLRNIDEPRVIEAMNAYDNYWGEIYRTQKENTASERESKYYVQEIEKLKKYRPTQTDVTEFLKEQLKAQEIKEERAEEFLTQLQLFKIEKQLKSQLDQGIITQEEYSRKLREEIRKFELEKLENR